MMPRALRLLWLPFLVACSGGCMRGWDPVHVSQEVVLPWIGSEAQGALPDPVVPVGFPEGRQGRFLLDSGASCGGMDADRARAWGLLTPTPPFPWRFCCCMYGPGCGQGALGSKIEWARYARVEAIRLGALSIPVDVVPVISGCDEDGLIGVNVLNRLAVLFDPEKRQVRLLDETRVPGRLAELYPGRRVERVPLRRALLSERPMVDLRIGDRRIPALLDTGSTDTSLPPDLVASCHLPETGALVTVSDVYGDTAKVPQHWLADVQIGKRGVSTNVLAMKGQAVLGMDVLGRSPFVLDGPHRILWIVLPEADGSDPFHPSAGH